MNKLTQAYATVRDVIENQVFGSNRQEFLCVDGQARALVHAGSGHPCRAGALRRSAPASAGG